MTATTAERTHADHEHQHGEGCGHVAFAHAAVGGTHIDYVHDGHVHVEHDGHWDECGDDDHSPHGAHGHSHGLDCGHVGIPHEGHVDYVHDGHRHTKHDDHYDEH